VFGSVTPVISMGILPSSARVNRFAPPVAKTTPQRQVVIRREMGQPVHCQRFASHASAEGFPVPRRPPGNAPAISLQKRGT